MGHISRLVGENQYLLSDIHSNLMREQVIKDGYGYCINTDTYNFIKVEVIPDSELYCRLEDVPDEEAKLWYASFNRIDLYEDCKRFANSRKY